MKLTPLLTFVFAVSAAACASAASLLTYVASADPNASPDSNGGTVDAWTLVHTGGGTAPDNYGSFLGNSANNGGGASGAGAGTSAWGLYSNQNYAGATGDNEVDINHTFDGGALTIGQSVSIAFDGGYADPGNEYGIRLFGPSGFVFALRFAGGGTYRYYDSTPGGTDAGFGFSPDGFTLKYTQTGAGTYAARVTNGATTLGSWTGTESGAPDFIQVYNQSAGNGGNYDVYANNLSIVPEPGSLALVGIGGVMLSAAGRRTRRRRV